MKNKDRVQINRMFAYDKPTYELIIDGHIIGGVTVEQDKEFGQLGLHIISSSVDSLKKITALGLYELTRARIVNLHLKNWIQWEGFDISVSFHQDHPEFKSRQYFQFEVEFEPDVENWNYPYSYNDYYKRFRQICETEFGDRVLFGSGGIKTKFMSVVDAVLNDLSIAEEVEKNVEPFIEIHKKTLILLKDVQFRNSLFASFNFPKELKIPCEQYLLYFAQFLQDLGIKATSNLKEEAGKVLFSVTPTDDKEALDKIREALAVYLNLPSSPIVYDDSFAAMRLQQQIENLQHSQKMTEREVRSSEIELRLSQTVIEHQDKIIQQKDTTIEQQNKIIEKITSKSIMMDSLENKEELEEIFDGFKVGESKFLKDQLGIHLNPATALKTLGKKLIGSEKKISSITVVEDDE